ncbi:MAG TPA: redox-regulated ATPase YchF [Candidatus Limnocylindrales bacterium]|nr:redox-regulated ATPase YchF [Candidatus Limnocylindrales bacterium]
MGLSIGIVGLPNVGKSTLFNALTKAQNAEAANYPFCTIEPNKAVVPVPDARLAGLARIANPERIVHATVDFVDIAGLVRGASKGEGLGNQFLTHIRETAAIVHVVRCFEDPDIVHVDGSVDPARDVEVIETELILADMQSIEGKIERLTRKAKGDKEAAAQLEVARRLSAHLGAGKPACDFPERDDNVAAALLDEMGLLSGKAVIYCANVDDGSLGEDNEHVVALRRWAASRNAAVVKISAKVEEELVGLDDAEKAEFLASYGVVESGIEQIIRRSYEILGLCSYFTAGPKEVRAWTIHRGWKAPKAASVIHTDFERGFIRAEVIAYDDYVAHKGEAGCKAAGVLRVEGKEYVVQDGDVMHFRFNV